MVPVASSTPEPPPTPTVSILTLEQKVRQVLICGYANDISATLGSCGNVILMGSNVQGLSVEAIRAITDQIHLHDPDAWIMIDEEGGRIQRIDIGAPTAQRMGQDGTSEYWGTQIGKTLKDAGIDLDLGPVCDIGHSSPAIGNRSFGISPEMVSISCKAFLQGLQSQNVYGVLKHLPGHGRVANDTHTGLGSLPFSWNEISGFDLIPFIETFNAGARIGMLGHIAVPSLDGETPASRSAVIIQKLRDALPNGQQIVLMTDSEGMGGSGRDPIQASIESLNAGADMVLIVSGNPATLYSAVLSAYQSGLLSVADLDQKVARIMALKTTVP
jgi:beta-N-acetylhexosaminidase